MDITNQAQLRGAFHYETGIKRRYRNGRPLTQNEYPADERMAWVEFVDAAERDGRISTELAQRATL